MKIAIGKYVDGGGRGGGQVASLLAFYSDDHSWSIHFSVKFVFEMNENKQKEAGDGPFFKKMYVDVTCRITLIIYSIRRGV